MLAACRSCYREPFLLFLLLAKTANLLAVVVGTYVFSCAHSWWHLIANSLTRMMFALYPAMLLFSLGVCWHELRAVRARSSRTRTRDWADGA